MRRAYAEVDQFPKNTLKRFWGVIDRASVTSRVVPGRVGTGVAFKAASLEPPRPSGRWAGWGFFGRPSSAMISACDAAGPNSTREDRGPRVGSCNFGDQRTGWTGDETSTRKALVAVGALSGLAGRVTSTVPRRNNVIPAGVRCRRRAACLPNRVAHGVPDVFVQNSGNCGRGPSECWWPGASRGCGHRLDHPGPAPAGAAGLRTARTEASRRRGPSRSGAHEAFGTGAPTPEGGRDCRHGRARGAAPTWEKQNRWACLRCARGGRDRYLGRDVGPENPAGVLPGSSFLQLQVVGFGLDDWAPKGELSGNQISFPRSTGVRPG